MSAMEIHQHFIVRIKSSLQNGVIIWFPWTQLHLYTINKQIHTLLDVYLNLKGYTKLVSGENSKINFTQQLHTIGKNITIFY
jgi:hypothetical protein